MKNPVFKPHIYSTAEIQALAGKAGDISPRDPLRGETLKTLFVLLYITGLRIGEALALNLEDYQKGHHLFIRKAKFHKQRLVPITRSTASALESYMDKRCKTSLPSSHDPLFVLKGNQRLSYSVAYSAFRSLLGLSGIYTGVDRAPRIHDFRHSFAVTRLLQAYREDEDPNSLLPALSTYMGHVDITSTQVYLHTTPELWEEANKQFLTYFRTHVLGSGGER